MSQEVCVFLWIVEYEFHIGTFLELSYESFSVMIMAKDNVSVSFCTYKRSIHKMNIIPLKQHFFRAQVSTVPIGVLSTDLKTNSPTSDCALHHPL